VHIIIKTEIASHPIASIYKQYHDIAPGRRVAANSAAPIFNTIMRFQTIFGSAVCAQVHQCLCQIKEHNPL
jgi:hypothetical protein